MKVNFSLVLLLLGCGFCLAQESSTIPAEAPKINTTTAAPVTTTTPSTTTEPSTTSTTTTTEPSTTSTTPEPSTTSVPTTTAAPIPTTPAPKPVPEQGKWFYNSTKEVCVIVWAAIELNVTYETKDNGTASAQVMVPKTATVNNGSCKNDTQFISLQWDSNIPTLKNQLELSFSKVVNKSDFALSTLQVVLVLDDHFPNAFENQTTLLNKQMMFETPLKMSYHCTKQRTVNLTSTDGYNSTLFISEFNIEAFRSKIDDNLSTAKDCEGVDTPDIVPIAVGCALALLIVIVLIAYLVGRRRQQARGYLSM